MEIDLISGSITTPTFAITNIGDAYFSGSISSSNADLGGWTIDSNSIYSGTKGSNGVFTTAGSITMGSTGFISSPQFYISTAGTATFKGVLSAPTGNIGGWNINGGTLKSNNNYITLDSSNNQITLKDTNSKVKLDVNTNSTLPVIVGSSITNRTFTVSQMLYYTTPVPTINGVNTYVNNSASVSKHTINTSSTYIAPSTDVYTATVYTQPREFFVLAKGYNSFATLSFSLVVRQNGNIVGSSRVVSRTVNGWDNYTPTQTAVSDFWFFEPELLSASFSTTIGFTYTIGIEVGYSGAARGSITDNNNRYVSFAYDPTVTKNVEIAIFTSGTTINSAGISVGSTQKRYVEINALPSVSNNALQLKGGISLDGIYNSFLGGDGGIPGIWNSSNTFNINKTFILVTIHFTS